MSGIKYYQLADGEELPDEFCAVRDVGGEPTEYTFYRQEAENAKLREFASEAFSMAFNFYHGAGTAEDLRELTVEYRELGIEAEQ